MGSGRRNDECDSCGARYGTWVPSLGMVLCTPCEGAGAAHPARDPVLVGDVLAGLVDAAAFAVRGGGAVRDVRLGEAIRDVRRAAVGVPEPRSGGTASAVPRAAGPAASACRRCGPGCLVPDGAGPLDHDRARGTGHRRRSGGQPVADRGGRNRGQPGFRRAVRHVPGQSLRRLRGESGTGRLPRPAGPVAGPRPADRLIHRAYTRLGERMPPSVARKAPASAGRASAPAAGGRTSTVEGRRRQSERRRRRAVSPACRAPPWRSARRPADRRRSPSPGSASGSRSR